MSRNKYPEQTKQKILEVSGKLFMEKGYDNTSLQDIINEIHMSKGAIYHHFKSKEEIFEHFIETYFNDIKWFDDIRNDNSLNGLEKLQKIFFHELGSEVKIKVDTMNFNSSIARDSKLIMAHIHSSVREIAPLLALVIKEGKDDGSLTVDSPKEASEMLLLLINMWFNPELFPATQEELLNKLKLVGQILNSIGIPLFDDNLLKLSENYFKSVFK